MSGNYPWIIRGFTSENYDLVYHHAEKWRFIGILAYPKILDDFLQSNRNSFELCLKGLIGYVPILR